MSRHWRQPNGNIGTLPIIIKGDDQGMHVTRSSGSSNAMHHLINGMLPLIGNTFWSAGSFSSALYLGRPVIACRTRSPTSSVAEKMAGALMLILKQGKQFR